MFSTFLIVALFGAWTFSVDAYRVPAAQFVVLHPMGFEVSIPASKGVTLFAFHGKLNEQLNDLEAGSWSQDIVHEKGGRFTFQDRITKLKEGDIINFWTFVVHNGLGYRQDNGAYIVVTGTAEPTTTRSLLDAEPITTNRSNSSQFYEQATTSFPGPIEQLTSTPDVGSIITSTTQVPVLCDESWTIIGNNEHPCKDKLIFEDNFDRLDSTKWRVEQRFSSNPDYEFVVYTNRSDTISISNGVLAIQPVRLDESLTTDAVRFGAECTGSTSECQVPALVPPIASGQLSTIDTFSFIYGRIEVRAHLPSATWVFPQIVLQPLENYYGAQDYASGQMRLAHASAGEALIGGVLLDSQAPFRLLKMCRFNGVWSDDFHLYSLRWIPDEISLSIDGRLFCVLRAPFADASVNGQRPPTATRWVTDGGHMAPFDRKFYLRLGVGVGGHNDFFDHQSRPKPWRNDDRYAVTSFWTGVGDTDWPGTTPHLKVDYVRVYAL